MRLSFSATVASLMAFAALASAQDATCQAVQPDYSLGGSGAYQKCEFDRSYNAALVSAGGNPDLAALMTKVCTPAACSHSTLQTGITKYVTACNASIIAETANGNLLTVSKNLLEVFFAEPIYTIYCALDPNAKPLPLPAVTPPSYCLANSVSTPNNRFATDLAIYLTSGSLRASQTPFISNGGLDPVDVCSDCSQIAMNATVEYLKTAVVPTLGGYAGEFFGYWNKVVPAYNTMCKTSFTQTWPVGTQNSTSLPVSSSTSATPSATSTSAAPSPTKASDATQLVKAQLMGASMVALAVVVAMF